MSRSQRHKRVSPHLQAATSKPHTPARGDGAQGWQLSSLLQHPAKETAPAGTGQLSQPTAHCQAVPKNRLCLRLSESRSRAEERWYKLLVSGNEPWGRCTNLQLTITSHRQSSLLYTDVSFHLISSTWYIKSCLIRLRNTPRHFPLSFPSIWAWS